MSEENNVTDISRGRGDDPDWLKAANQIGRAAESDTGTPAAIDETIKRYDPVSDSLEEQLEASLRQRGLSRSEVEVADLAGKIKPQKTRVLTAAERKQQEYEAQRLEEEVAAEAKRFREIDPLRRPPFIVNLVVGCLIFVTSGVFSYAAIAAAATWMQPEWQWLVYIVPGFIELFIIWFGIETIINQAKAVFAKTQAARTYYMKQSKSATSWMLVFAMVAVFGNGAHTLERWLVLGDVIPWYGVIGITMSALAPLSVVLITKRMSRLIFVYAVEE